MFNKNTVRSALVLGALGMLAACSSGSGAGPAPAAKAASQGVQAHTVMQKASVKIASITDAQGNAVALESSAVLGQLATIDRAEVSKEAVLKNGNMMERSVIDLRDAHGSVLRFIGDANFGSLALTTRSFPATAAAANVVNGKVAQLSIRVSDGRVLDVVLAFGADQSQDMPKQDNPKQDTPKQDTPKQDTPKQDTPKQDTPKQDTPKQDSPKQDTPKQDSPKQDSPKQDTPKQDTPKQDTPKQDTPKQDSPKQDSPKQDTPKQDSPKQDTPKQDSPKQDSPKQDNPKQG